MTAFAVFRDGAGHERRTIGVAIRRAEPRPIARALTEYADSLEAAGAKGTP